MHTWRSSGSDPRNWPRRRKNDIEGNLRGGDCSDTDGALDEGSEEEEATTAMGALTLS